MPKVQDEQTRVSYLGIDPGASGGMAIISGDHVDLVAMPPTERDIFDWINAEDVTFAIVEEIPPAIFEIDKSSCSKLYGNYMALRMVLTACGIPFETCKARDWQSALGIPKRRPATGKVDHVVTKGKNKGKTVKKKTGGESQSEWKNRLKAAAQRIFPGETITLAVADAILISEYCRRKREGLLKIG